MRFPQNNIAVFFSLILLSAVFSLNINEISGEEDLRDKNKEISKKIEEDLAKAKQNLKLKITEWKNSKVATDQAKENYSQNPTVSNLLILENAKKDEKKAYDVYQGVLADVKNFKIKLDEEKIIKIKNVGETKELTKTNVRSDFEQVSQKVQLQVSDINEELKLDRENLKKAKDETENAKNNFLANPSEENKLALEDAQKKEEESRQNFKNSLNLSQNFKAKLDEENTEKSNKKIEDIETKENEIRKKSEEISMAIQKEIEKAYDNLKASYSNYKNAKDAKDAAKQVFLQNPNDSNLLALETATQTEATELFFYKKALLEVQNFKIQLENLN